jgi:hypothetical protein
MNLKNTVPCDLQRTVLAMKACWMLSGRTFMEPIDAAGN